MPLRVFPFPAKKDEGTSELVPPTEARSFWRTSLLLVTSAAFGGIAVAIWNRRTLALMRQQSEPTVDTPAEEPPPPPIP